MKNVSKTLPATVTSSEKGLQPYWNARLTEIQSQLWLPTATDSCGSALTCSTGYYSGQRAESWFSIKILEPAQKQNLPKVFSQLSQYLQQDHTGLGNAVTRSRKIRIYPTAYQRKLFRGWHGVSRYAYNQTVEWLNVNPNEQISWIDLAKIILASLPAWAGDAPFKVKKMAVKEAWIAMIEGKKKAKRTGSQFNLHFRLRKTPVQSCYIPSTAFSRGGIYGTYSGPVRFSEDLPDEKRDSRLIEESGRWFVSTPIEVPCQSENQAARMVALDPGVRTFLTFYSHDLAGFIGEHDFGRFVRLCAHLDGLLSRAVKAASRKRRRMLKAADRLRWKIKDLRDELHWKAIDFLLNEFDVILLPSFEVSKMVKKDKRKIGRKTVRAMLTLGHYQFEQRLKAKAEELGKTVIIVNEAYTSKTCSWSGEIVKVGSREIIHGSDGISMHRDMNGARGIFLRALVDTPMPVGIQS